MEPQMDTDKSKDKTARKQDWFCLICVHLCPSVVP